MTTQDIFVHATGGKFYYSDKEMQVPHREDGPAFEFVVVNGLKYQLVKS